MHLTKFVLGYTLPNSKIQMLKNQNPTAVTEPNIYHYIWKGTARAGKKSEGPEMHLDAQ